MLGIDALLGRAFPCVIPGHRDRQPSASLFKQEDGVWRYRDWHVSDDREWWSLAEVRAAQFAGRPLPRLSRPSTALWYRRLFYEAGVGDLTPVELPPLVPGSAPDVEAARRGFELLLGLREAAEPGVGAPFTRGFAAVWCRLSEDRARAAIDELRRQHVIEKVGKHGRTFLYRPGPGPATLQRARRRAAEQQSVRGRR